MIPPIKKGDTVYWGRVVLNQIYDVLELKIRTVDEEGQWFVGTEKREKHAFLFSFKKFGKDVFYDRKSALRYVHEAERLKTKDYKEVSKQDNE